MLVLALFGFGSFAVGFLEDVLWYVDAGHVLEVFCVFGVDVFYPEVADVLG